MNAWNVTNGVLFQIAWFACVIGGGAAGSMWWGSAVLLLMLGQSLLGPSSGRDLMLASVAGVTGFVIDTVWIRTGVLDYAGAALAPAWIVLLWVAVGLSVNHCLSMFKTRPWLGGALAGLGAPFSYLGGERLGAVTIDEPLQLAAVSLAWLFLFTITFAVAREGEETGSGPGSDYERAH